MIHVTTSDTQYILGDQTFDAFGLTSDYAGAKIDVRISRVRVQRNRDRVTVTINGNKLRRDGSESQVLVEQHISMSYESARWEQIWDQSPDEFKTGLTDADREAVIPS